MHKNVGCTKVYLHYTVARIFLQFCLMEENMYNNIVALPFICIYMYTWKGKKMTYIKVKLDLVALSLLMDTCS